MQGGFTRAKLLLRFLGELLNCGLVEAQEYGDMLATLCAGYVKTEARRVRQPCRDMLAYMVLSAVLRVGPTLSKVRTTSNLAVILRLIFLPGMLFLLEYVGRSFPS